MGGRPTENGGRTAVAIRPAHTTSVRMALVAIFILGIGNFTMHAAIRHSGHPLLGKSRWYVHGLGGRLTLVTEFLLLLAALLLAADGRTWPAWLYLAYSLLNALAAWLIISRRI